MRQVLEAALGEIAERGDVAVGEMSVGLDQSYLGMARWRRYGTSSRPSVLGHL